MHVQFIWLSEVLATLIWHVLILHKVRGVTVWIKHSAGYLRAG